MAIKPKIKQKQPKSFKAKKAISIDIGNSTDAMSLFEKLQSSSTPEAHTDEPVLGLDDLVKDIFTQASNHRERLIKFFIRYTSIFSVVVGIIIVGQAIIRIVLPGKESIEIIPYWALNLLLFGMFGQFIALLAIVTRKVWSFEKFFDQASNKHSSSDIRKEKDNESK